MNDLTRKWQAAETEMAEALLQISKRHDIDFSQALFMLAGLIGKGISVEAMPGREEQLLIDGLVRAINKVHAATKLQMQLHATPAAGSA